MIGVLTFPVLSLGSPSMFSASKSTSPLAFDIEWQPSYKKGEPENPTSLVQLGDGLHVVLIHLSLMNHVAPVELVTLMEDPNVLKLGVGIHGDASKLEKDLGIITRGCLDLNDIAWRKDPGVRGSTFHPYRPGICSYPLQTRNQQ